MNLILPFRLLKNQLVLVRDVGLPLCPLTLKVWFARAGLLPLGVQVARKRLVGTRRSPRHAKPRHLRRPARMVGVADG